MKKRQIAITLLAFLASNILFWIIINFLPTRSLIIIIGWLLIVLQALATVVLFGKNKMPAAIVGMVWVGMSLIIQFTPWLTVFGSKS